MIPSRIKGYRQSEGSLGVICKCKCQQVERRFECQNPRTWKCALLHPQPIIYKETYPSTWLDWETSILSRLPTELFVKFIFLSLLSVDLTMFLLYSLGYNQYTSGFDWTHKTRKYEYIASLPQWISDWLWDHRQNDHIRMASRLMDWEDSCTYADWSEICRRLKFDGDDPPEVYKKCRFEKGDLWSSIHL